MVLRCIWSIELVCGGKIWENGRKIHILDILRDLYRYTLDLYRYSLGSGRFWPTCTDIGQSCTGTGNALFSYFDQFSYFSHNLLISYPI